jgi:hypothetical protein
MKILEIKQQVYQLTDTTNTDQLKKKYPQLVKHKDLRYKQHWSLLLKELQTLHHNNLDVYFDLSLDDLEKSETMLKESLFTVSRLAGLSDEEIEIDWQRIKLESQVTNLHLEEL